MAVEEAFENKLTSIGNVTPDAPHIQEPENKPTERKGHERTPAASFGQKVMVLRKPSRERDRLHLRFVAGQPCLVCGRAPSDAHHVKFAESWTAGRKVSDRFTVPLCRVHHHELHRRGNHPRCVMRFHIV